MLRQQQPRLHKSGLSRIAAVHDHSAEGQQSGKTDERDATIRSIRRVKSRVQAILHANLVPKYAGHLFGKSGRRWLKKVPLPLSERDLLGRHRGSANLAIGVPSMGGSRSRERFQSKPLKRLS